MRIKIQGFKCHLDEEYSFEEGQMSLIKGESGRGKSTILQAIFWALYGNMRSIYNNNGAGKNLYVTLELPGFIISRKKNPELLVVFLEDKRYEDLVAQRVIDNHFGSREVWKACSYIEQQSRCSLLSGSNAERMELLNALSFTGESPNDYISSINQKLKEVNHEFSTFQASFTTEIELYSQSLKKKPVLCIGEKESILKCEEDISNLEKEEKELFSKCQEEERKKGARNYLLSEISKLEKVFLNLPEIPEIPPSLYTSTPFPEFLEINPPDMKKKNSLALEISKISENLEKRNRCEQKLSNFNLSKDLLEKYKNITSEEIWNLKKMENEREKMKKEAKNMGLEYNEEVLSKTLSRLSEQLTNYNNLEKHLNNYLQLVSIEKALEEIRIDERRNLEELEELSRQKASLISELKKGLELLSCPKCSTPLRYLSGKLVLGEREPVSKGEIEKANQDYSEMLKIIERLKQIKNYEQNLDFLNNSLSGISREELDKYSKNKKESLKKLISKLSSISFLKESETSSKNLEEIYSYWNLRKEIEKIGNTEGLEEKQLEYAFLEEEYSKYQKTMEEKDKKLKEHALLEKKRQDELRKYEDLLKKRERVEEELLKKREEVGKIFINESFEKEYSKIGEKLKDERRRLEDLKYGKEMKEKELKYAKKRENLLSLHEDLQALYFLKTKAVEVECKQLEDTVNNINTVLETTLPIFFNDPISLKLLLYKQLKSKKDSYKPGINLEIHYKGSKYDNVNSLSGGEGDRISLALLLALNSVSNSPLILLDECVSSLDGDLKESCITAIKSIPGKTVLCVDHDDSLEGFYDSVFSI